MRFQGFHRRLLMKFSSSCASALKIVVHKCTYCQKTMTGIRRVCEARGIFLWEEKYYKSLLERHDFWVEYLIATLCIAFEKLQATYLCQLEMELQISQILIFFLTILKFILNFPYGKQGCVFFALHRHVFSQCIKMTWGRLKYCVSNHCVLLTKHYKGM